MIELNKDIAQRYAKVLVRANEHWFYGYHWAENDQVELIEALDFFDHIKNQLQTVVDIDEPFIHECPCGCGDKWYSNEPQIAGA